MADIFDELQPDPPGAAPQPATATSAPRGDIFDEIEAEQKGDIFDELQPDEHPGGMRSWIRALSGVSPVQNLKKSVANLFEGAAGTFTAEGQKPARGLVDENDTALRSFQKTLTGVADLINEEADKKIAADLPKDMTKPQEVVVSGLNSFFQNLPWLAAGVATGNPAVGLTGLATQAGVDAYGQGVKEGMSHKQALDYGVSQGAIEAMTEKLPLDMLAKWGKGPIRQTIGKYLAKDIGGELVAEYLSNLNKRVSEGNIKANDLEALEREAKAAWEESQFLETAASTIVSGGALVATAKVANKPIEAVAGKAAEVEAKARDFIADPAGLKPKESFQSAMNAEARAAGQQVEEPDARGKEVLRGWFPFRQKAIEKVYGSAVEREAKKYGRKPEEVAADLSRDIENGEAPEWLFHQSTPDLKIYGKKMRDAMLDGVAEYMEETQQRPVVFGIDIKNVKGQNENTNESYALADESIRNSIVFLKEELTKVAPHAEIARQGGDELSGVVFGASKTDIELALSRARERFDQYAKTRKVTLKDGTVTTLSEVPHGDKSLAEQGVKGTDLYIGVGDAKGATGAKIGDQINALVSIAKERGKNVSRKIDGNQPSSASGATEGSGKNPGGSGAVSDGANGALAPEEPGQAGSGSATGQAAEEPAGPNPGQVAQPPTPPTDDGPGGTFGPSSAGAAQGGIASVPQRLAKARTESPKEQGDPKLANPGQSEAVRSLVDVVDEIQKNEKETIDLLTLFEDGWKKYEADPKGYIEEARRAANPTAEQTLVLREVMNREGIAAIKSGDPARIIEAALIVADYRLQGAEQGRALVARRDLLKSPAQRAREFGIEAILMPDAEARKKFQKATTPEQKKQALKGHEKIVAKVQHAIERLGIDFFKESQRLIDAEQQIKDLQGRLNKARQEAMNARIAVIREESKGATKDAKNAKLRTELEAQEKANEKLKATIAELEKELGKQRAIQEAAENKVARAINAAHAARADYSDALVEYWRSAILSAPTTQVANVLGNSANIAWNLSVKRLTEATVNLAVRDPEAAQMGELKAISSAISGKMFKDAWRRARLAFDREGPVFSEELGYNGQSKISESTGGPAIEGEKGRIIRIPLRLLVAADEMSKSISWNLEVAAQAYRIAKAEKLTGDAFEKRMSELVSDPRSEAGVAAYDFAVKMAFQEQSDTATSVANARNKIPGAVFILPFVPTPFNIVKQGLKATPLGSLPLMLKLTKKTAVKLKLSDKTEWNYKRSMFVADGAEQVLAWGTAMALYAAIVGGDGEPWLTGSAASIREKGQREQQFRNAPPQSIRIGDKWVSYSRVEPLASMLTATVDMLSSINDAKNGKDIGAVIGDSMKHLTALVRDKTFLQGVGDVMRALEDPENFVPSWASSFAASWTPNLIKSIGRADDPVFRDYSPKGQGVAEFGAAMLEKTGQRALPIESLAPMPKVDLWGRDIEKGGPGYGPNTDFLYRVLSPVNIQKADDNRLDRLIMAWNNKYPDDGFYPATPKKFLQAKGERITLTDEEFNQFAKMSGQKAFEILSAVKELNPENPQRWMIELIDKTIQEQRKVAADVLFAKSKKAEAIKDAAEKEAAQNK
jgi:fructose-specific component phosphotransferase system IIB-like protein